MWRILIPCHYHTLERSADGKEAGFYWSLTTLMTKVDCSD